MTLHLKNPVPSWEDGNGARLGCGWEDHDSRSLANLHLSLGTPNHKELSWLNERGVGPDDLINPWPIGACNVRFERGTFTPDPDGERALTILLLDFGHDAVDIAAWAPRSGRIASYYGSAFAINEPAIFNPVTYMCDGALHVHETPLEWLREGRTGIVIIEPENAYHYLRTAERISVDVDAFAAKLAKWIEPPRPEARLFIRSRRHGA